MPDKIIAIGGMGGSGTRVVSDLLMTTDIYLGSCLNKAGDNLIFSVLFRQLSYDVKQDVFLYHYELFRRVMRHEILNEKDRAYLRGFLEKRMHFSNTRKAYDHLMATDREPFTTANNKWGWKAPNTHIFLPRFLELIPRLKYVHVIRHGLDMAFSNNIKQPKIWGELITGKSYTQTPAYQLRYWVEMHKRIMKLKEDYPDSVYLLRFDELCEQPDLVIRQLFHFLEEELKGGIKEYTQKVNSPDTIGRFRQHDIRQFPPEDIEYVASLGFSV